MKKFALTAAAVAALTASPLAAKDLAAELDADGNGTFSLEELQLAFPELTAETFATIDANADGEADAEEVTAAMEAGVLANAG
ncbi:MULTISPECIES: calcium-binding protein [unclassified Leisingera]|uniref:calcium-binding protein n=1 Tax=unclassified Leisingera TaxID=2614906 RepID=UPI0003185345|nr:MULTISPECIES: calcium-binding protein [unclassified Leisingera]KIC16764.1 calcium-binding protein [Leisingera sp. ANG-DT]KIC25664.1 calcium-binding protein [Leisingera sp. ANG-S3]KIC29348.1 calcium-binding protein [Leisingera sp. ANG-M6]KIC34482.1 calcium-binding protein [Leisingera sp. ANG-S5]KIC54232.1 calcium-binding protein [Leisingera sp. ANG-S]